MARTANPKLLARAIASLRSQRQALVDKLADIDATFAELGLSADEGARRGRRPGRPAGSVGKRKRGSFAKSGEQSVLDFVKSHGKPNAADVNKHWQGEGRGGKADNALSKLVKEGKLKRVEVKGERGARYTTK